MRANAKRRPVGTDDASGIDHAAKLINPINNRNNSGLQIVRAEIINSGECSAEGYTALGGSPVFALCRKLIEAGFDPERPLFAYRGVTMALRIRSIGEAATLEINGHGSGFKQCPARRGPASPMRQTEVTLAGDTFEPIGAAAARLLEKISSGSRQGR